LKVGGGGRGAEDVIARRARAKIYVHTYFVPDHAYFCTIEAAITVDEKVNCKSSGIDLATIEPHFAHNEAWKMLRNLYCNNTGLEYKGGLQPPNPPPPLQFLRL
jgi:hypothetical protein